MRPIPPVPKPIQKEEPKFIFICNRGESLVDSKETKQGFALLVKEEVNPPTEIDEKMKLLFGEFKEAVGGKLLKGFPPMRDIQHHV